MGFVTPGSKRHMPARAPFPVDMQGVRVYHGGQYAQNYGVDWYIRAGN